MKTEPIQSSRLCGRNWGVKMDKPYRIVLPNPAASSLSFVVPANEDGIWTLRSITALITTDATVATRLFSVSVTDAEGNVYARWTAGQTQTASQALTYSWMAGMSIQSPTASGATGVSHMCLPEVVVEQGDIITISDIAAAAAGDRITQCVVTLEVL